MATEDGGSQCFGGAPQDFATEESAEKVLSIVKIFCPPDRNPETWLRVTQIDGVSADRASAAVK